MKRTLPLSALVTGLPLLAWQLVFFLGSMIILVWMTFWTIQNYLPTPDFSIESWQALLQSQLFYDIYLRTLFYAFATALLAVVIAFPAAYGLTMRLQRRTMRIAMMLLIVPFFTSYLIRAYSWRFMLENDGVVNAILGFLHLPTVDFQGSFAAVVIGYFAYFLPLVVLIQILGLMNIDKSLLEAAHNLGAGRWRTVFTVVLPIGRGALVSSFLFAFMMAMGDFVAPSLIGGGARPTLSVMIVNTIQGQSNFPRAAAIALIMLATMLTVFFAVNALFNRRRKD